jgi:hypothetical protein
MSYLEVANSSQAQGRIEDLMFTAARSILVEAGSIDKHVTRVTMANNILAGNTGKLVVQMTKFVLTNVTIAQAMASYMLSNSDPVSGFMNTAVVTDQAAEFEVSASWNTLAIATYGDLG